LLEIIHFLALGISICRTRDISKRTMRIEPVIGCLFNYWTSSDLPQNSREFKSAKNKHRKRRSCSRKFASVLLFLVIFQSTFCISWECSVD